MNEHRTENFILTQAQDGAPVEIWVDWIPAIDDAPGSAVEVVQHGQDLLVRVPGSQLPTVLPRRLVALEVEALDELRAHGGCWVLCGPSGMLGRVPFQLG